MTKTVTLGEEIVRDVETYRHKLETKSGQRVTFARAFRKVMEVALQMLDDEINKTNGEATP